MNGIGEQSHRSRDQHDHHLGGSSCHQSQKTDFHRPDAGGTGLQGAVNAVGRVVAVRGEDLPHCRADSSRASTGFVTVFVTVPVFVPVPVPVFVPVGHTRRPSR